MNREVQQEPQAAASTRSTVLPSGIPLNTGSEWIIEAGGCCAEQLRRQAELQALCDAVIADLDLNVVGVPQWHQFPEPGGVTGLYLLSESHLACHSFPEYHFLTVNLYCCRERAAWDWQTELSQRLGAQQTVVRKVRREIPQPVAPFGGDLT